MEELLKKFKAQLEAEKEIARNMPPASTAYEKASGRIMAFVDAIELIEEEISKQPKGLVELLEEQGLITEPDPDIEVPPGFLFGGEPDGPDHPTDGR